MGDSVPHGGKFLRGGKRTKKHGEAMKKVV
jgi:hypothetical protein